MQLIMRYTKIIRNIIHRRIGTDVVASRGETYIKFRRFPAPAICHAEVTDRFLRIIEKQLMEILHKNEPFGSRNPFAEPPWYTGIYSPYYKESHRRLRTFIRAYMDEYIIPHCEEWETQGFIPQEVNLF